SGLDCVLRLQVALMPRPGRRFPHEVELEHDYVSYFRSATRELYVSGRAGRPEQPLEAHGPATFVVEGDPWGLCTTGVRFRGDSRDLMLEGDFHLGMAAAHELLSPLTRVLPAMSGRKLPIRGPEVAAATLAAMDLPTPGPAETDEAADTVGVAEAGRP